jgi:hypothetical protein
MSNNKGGTTDAEFWKSLYGSAYSSWDSNYGNSSGYGNSYYDSDWTTRKNKREHKFSPVLLIYTTVYNCEHCGRKKEDCKYTYCDDEDNPPTWDIGDW